MNNKQIIWSNYDLNYEDFREQIEEAYPDYSEDEKLQLMYEINNDYLDDERMNLDIDLGQPILVIADLGLWDGRKSGYKEIMSGNIKDCLYSDNDYNTWYLDKDGDFCCDSIHHDGTNHYRYRVFRYGLLEDERYELMGKIYNGSATEDDIQQYTRRIGDEIAKVYGWEIPPEPERMTDTNIGRMPLSDYREIKAVQFGFDNYEEMYNSGHRFGHGLDEAPTAKTVKDYER